MKKVLSTALIVLGVAFVSGFAYYRWKFPHGWSHCCIQIVASSLREYADDHEGKFPAGESSGEASLSLLYREQLLDAYTLRGMTVPEKRVRAILDNGGLLGPTTCGWNYVPGLTKADNPELAILWCKEALGHNGDRNSRNGRTVGPGGQWDRSTTFNKCSLAAEFSFPLSTAAVPADEALGHWKCGLNVEKNRTSI